jgi:hypothetical protein
MVDPVTLQMLRDIVTIAGVGIGLVYYILNLRNARKTRQAQLFMQLYETYMDERFQVAEAEMLQDWEWKDFEDFRERYGYKNPKHYGSFTKEGTFFEAIGVLVNRGMIDITLVDDLMSGSVLFWWNKFGPLNIEIREKMNWPQNAEWIEYLYNRIKVIAEQQHPELRT